MGEKPSRIDIVFTCIAAVLIIVLIIAWILGLEDIKYALIISFMILLFIDSILEIPRASRLVA